MTRVKNLIKRNNWANIRERNHGIILLSRYRLALFLASSVVRKVSAL